MEYNVQPKVITATANIYDRDKSSIRFGTTEKEIEITSAIRQGCTGLTVLFKLITYIIITDIRINRNRI